LSAPLPGRPAVRPLRAAPWGAAALLAFTTPAVPAAPQGAADRAPAQVVVRLENPLALARPDEVIALSWAALGQRLPGLDTAQVRAVDAGTGAELPTQPVDSDGDGRTDQLLVLMSFWPNQVRELLVEPRAPTTRPVPRAYARHVAERDDMAWESDRIAYRIYGQGLWKQEDLHSSGIDVWVKRTRDLVVDRWYSRGHDSYHRDSGEGADFYTVGPSLGAGGDAVWKDGRLYRAENFRSWRVLAAGPVRAIFEVTYDPFDAGGVRVSETRRFVMDAGQNLFREVTTFHTDSAARAAPLTYAIGFVKHAQGQVASSRWTTGGRVWLSTWQPVERANGGHGELGLGLLLERSSLLRFQETDDHILALATARPEQPVVHYVGACWTASGDCPHVRAWWRALDALAERLASPIRVTMPPAGAGTAAAPLSDSLAPRAVLRAMTAVADWQLDHPSAHLPYEWQGAPFWAGLYELALLSPDRDRYLEAIRRNGDSTRWRPGPRPLHADDDAVTQSYFLLYRMDRDRREIEPALARFDSMLSLPFAESLEFSDAKTEREWVWCDALFMAPPALALATATTGDRRYAGLMDRLWWKTTDYLYDRHERLFYRDSRFFDRREPNGRKVFWSRGNGWVLAGLARVLQYLPPDWPTRPRYVKLFREMAARVAGLQGRDGYWRASLLDPDSRPTPETSGTAFFTYALAWGVHAGLLGPEYVPRVRLGWSALVRAVQPDGLLGYVQPVGAEPGATGQDQTEIYGAGAFLLAGSEIYRAASRSVQR
jgi:rhamnogalacturonyl hydrolase YesR